MNSIKIILFTISILFLSACKTVPTSPAETPVPEPEASRFEQKQAGTEDSTSAKPDYKSATQNEQAPTEQFDEQNSAISGSSLTPAEQTEKLEEKLDDRFAEFDRLLLREREYLSEEEKSQGAPQGGGGSAGGSGLDGFDDLDDFDDIASEEPLTQNNTAQQKGNNEGAFANGNTNAGVPPDLVNTKGDDVIARQLREAALKEKDPVLREKLWDEYRKYKSGI